MVREWILAGLPNFLNSSDVSRNMWSLTLFFIGVSSAAEISTLLPFACLRRRTPQIHQLFIHSALDLYSTVSLNIRQLKLCFYLCDNFPKLHEILFHFSWTTQEVKISAVHCSAAIWIPEVEVEKILVHLVTLENY